MEFGAIPRRIADFIIAFGRIQGVIAFAFDDIRLSVAVAAFGFGFWLGVGDFADIDLAFGCAIFDSFTAEEAAAQAECDGDDYRAE